VPSVSGSNGTEEIIQAGELILRPDQFTVTARGRVLSLSRREFDLLLYLTRRPGRVIPREEVHVDVWGAPYDKADRSVDVYVHKIRTKLARALPEWQYIHTHFGFGYRFQPERSQDFHNSATTR
jgi:DNA-binding response OmpR family regulator